MKQTPIFFSQIFNHFNQKLEEKNYPLIFILVDENTHEHCLPQFLSEMEGAHTIEIIEIPAGEENKTIDIAIQVWETMTEMNATRKSLMINLGGGMVTDLGGFIASTFKRGIDFINFPTSILSMVDAAVGGKTGIDHNGIKNIIGTFALPVGTFIHPEFLQTLPKREFWSGLAEMLKHGLIYDKNHWENLINLENLNPESVSVLISDSVQIKTEIIDNDPFESGIRKILNFGHTIGHAIESEFLETENHLLHGEAIAIGMMVESILSFENELISKEELDEIFTHLVRIFGKFSIPEDLIPNLFHWMKHDKKNQNDQISFSLLDGIGKCKYDILLNENQISEGILMYNRKLANS
ncbi:3-dehydroquinate synthase [Moheibacter lacus]|uniref:3-dehydroquinate synthase n=1 Tax=Moheibacter lacus TaxID=2745851 RepID=A0A838ZKV6_9FLAO|nr:3-dehydroquinate synthase [Moheibacter lacus]MBA5628320.1 3-dehydroquinate synthase [Moheibacter lacus]